MNRSGVSLKLKLMRSTGPSEEVSLSKDHTLHDLKTQISRSKKLGKVPVSLQRIFHMGRELKTAGRTLENLGVGKLGPVVIVHAVPGVVAEDPPVIDLADDDDDDDDEVVILEGPELAAQRPARKRVRTK